MAAPTNHLSRPNQYTSVEIIYGIEQCVNPCCQSTADFIWSSCRLKLNLTPRCNFPRLTFAVMIPIWDLLICIKLAVFHTRYSLLHVPLHLQQSPRATLAVSFPGRSSNNWAALTCKTIKRDVSQIIWEVRKRCFLCRAMSEKQRRRMGGEQLRLWRNDLDARNQTAS